MRADLAQRLESRSIPEPNSGCVLWLAATTGAGYGAIAVDGKQMPAHRVAWEIANGPIPKGLFVCHKCDVRSCINPDHLFLGTQSDNMVDCSRKGRIAKNQSAKTHCARGHAYDEANTRYYQYGGMIYRYCRRCDVLRQPGKRARRRLRRVM